MGRWIKKNKERISLRKSKLLASKRADPRMLDHVRELCAQVMKARERFPMKSDNAINCDKARVFAGQGGELIIESKKKERVQRRGAKGISIGALATFATAAGVALISVNFQVQ